MSEKTKKPRKKSVEQSEFSLLEGPVEKQKGLTLFDHIKHISKVQDPDYFDSLSELDKKTFNHFMILRGLSMNPALLDDISFLYRVFDSIPSPQFYKLLIFVIPPENPRNFHPWIKGKKSKYEKQLIELLTKYFEISPQEVIEYIDLYIQTEKGRKELYNICRGYGLNEKELKEILPEYEQPQN